LHVSRIYWDIWRQKHRVRNPISYWSQYDLRKLSFWTFPGWNFNFLIVDKRNLTLQLKFEHFRNATAIIKGRYIVTFQIYLRLNKMVWTDVFHSLLISNCLFSIVGLSKVTCSQKSSFFFKHVNLIRWLVISEKIKSVGTTKVSTRQCRCWSKLKLNSFLVYILKASFYFPQIWVKFSGVKNISFEIFVHPWLVEAEEAEARKYFNNIQ